MPVTPYSSRLGKPHKNKKELAERIDRKLRAMHLHAGHAEFDPVEMMALIGAEAYDEGDKHLALVAFKEVSQYVRPKLAATTIEHKKVPQPHSRTRILGAFSRMGVKVEASDASHLVQEVMERDGITYEEAAQVVEQETGVEVLPNVVAIPAIAGPEDDN